MGHGTSAKPEKTQGKGTPVPGTQKQGKKPAARTSHKNKTHGPALKRGRRKNSMRNVTVIRQENPKTQHQRSEYRQHRTKQEKKKQKPGCPQKKASYPRYPQGGLLIPLTNEKSTSAEEINGGGRRPFASQKNVGQQGWLRKKKKREKKYNSLKKGGGWGGNHKILKTVKKDYEGKRGK